MRITPAVLAAAALLAGAAPAMAFPAESYGQTILYGNPALGYSTGMIYGGSPVRVLFCNRAETVCEIVTDTGQIAWVNWSDVEGLAAKEDVTPSTVETNIRHDPRPLHHLQVAAGPSNPDPGPVHHWSGTSPGQFSVPSHSSGPSSQDHGKGSHDLTLPFGTF